MDAEVAARVEAIRQDRVSGASTLARQAVEALRLAAERSRAPSRARLLAELEQLSGALATARPSMAPLRSWASRYLARARALARNPAPDELVRRQIVELGGEFAHAMAEAASRTAQRGASLLPAGATVVTASFSTTVVETLALATRSGKSILALCLASPGPAGIRYGDRLAQDLAGQGVAAQVVERVELAPALARADLALAGADAILRDGALVNGTPTRALAEEAWRRGVPFLVVAETAKIDCSRNSDDVLAGADRSMLFHEEGFDLVPPAWVRSYVTEEAQLAPGDVGGWCASAIEAGMTGQ